MATIIGKRKGPSLSAPSKSGVLTRYLFVTDRNTMSSFHGSSVYIHRNLYKARYKSDYELSTANGTIIKAYGIELLTLNFCFPRDFTWRFIVTDVFQPIIGADFLSSYGFLDFRPSE